VGWMQPNFAFYSSLSAGIAVAAGLLALSLDGSGALRSLVALAAIVAGGWSAGLALAPQERGASRWFWGVLGHVAATIAVGTACYYVARFGMPATYGAAVLVPFLWVGMLVLRPPQAPSSSTTEPRPSWNVPQLLLCATALILFLLALRAWFGATSAESLRSPWEIAPRGAVLYVALGVLAALGAYKARTASHTDDKPLIAAPAIIALMMGVVAATTVALAVYRAGYGFDPFLHRAAERLVVTEGVVTPKTPYYVGQYVLVAHTARLTGIDVGSIDRWLVPLGASLLVPALYFALRRRGVRADAAVLGSSAALLAPLSSFIVTTPQGLANLIVALALCAASAAPTGALPLLLAIAATCTHPLSGLPVFLALCCRRLFRDRAATSEAAPSRDAFRIPRAVAIVGAAISVPAMFALNAATSGNGIHFVWPDGGLFAFADRLIGHLPYRRFDLWYDLAYWWKAAGLAVFLAAGAWAYRRERLRVPLVVALVLLANALILKGFARFPFLVEGEQLTYGGRLLELAGLALLPGLALWIARVGERLDSRNGGPRLALLVAIAALSAGNVYASYPHLDAYESNRGFSTSAHDVSAARAIADDAGRASYVVLANQSAAAGAIQELGFFRYFPSRDAAYPGELFAYPVPTTSPLYAQFLLLMSEPGNAASIAAEAQRLTGAERVYAIVDGYWWNAVGVRRELGGRALWSKSFGDAEAAAYRLK
jgi:hypothetical protein